jgi:diacylglycerol kinase family enzyme
MSTTTLEAPAAAERRHLLEPDQPRLAIVFNPASGTEDPALRRARVEAAARAGGLNGPLQETDRKLGARHPARKVLQDGIRRLLVRGGDGSVTEAASVLAGSNVELAVIPGGTRNLLAVNLGLPADADAAMRLPLTGEARPFDVGRIGQTVFLVMAGMGADARMIRDADRQLKRRYGVLAYAVAAWRHFRKPPTLYRITVDGRTYRRRAQTVLIANLGRITGGIELVGGANPEDGLLEVAILKAKTPRDLARIALRAFLGKIRGDELVEIHRGRHIVVRSSQAQPVQVDGNPFGTRRHMEARVEPGALRLVHPPAPAVPPIVAALAGGGRVALRLSLLAQVPQF